MSPSVKLGGNGFTTKNAVNGKRKVTPIAHPMIMGFDGITHFLHLDLMKVHRGVELRTLMNQAIKLFLDEVVKNGVKGGVQIHRHEYTLGDICSVDYASPCRKASSMSMSFSKVFSVGVSSPASLAFSSSKLRWNAVIAGSSDFR